MGKVIAIFRFAGLFAACGAIGWGCAKGEKDKPGGLASTNPVKPGESIIASMRRGIEVHRLLDRPFRHKLEPILSHYSADPLGLSAAQIAMWRNEGLRIVAVPADDESLRQMVLALTQESFIERVRMGVVPEWRAVATAPKIEGSKLVRVGGEIGAFADGRFRLLMRDYPLLGTREPVLRLELLVQFHQPKRDPFAPDAAKEERMGMYIPTSALSMDLDGQWAVVVTAADPQTNWSKEEPAADESSKGTPGEKAETENNLDGKPPADANAAHASTDNADAKSSAGQTGHAGKATSPPVFETQGPESPRIRTTGEETLIRPDGDTRLVLIFVPRLK